MYLFSKYAALALLAAATLSINQVSAYCPRCAQIEQQRAEEQKRSKPVDRYYDDFISLNNEEQADDDDDSPTQHDQDNDSKSINPSTENDDSNRDHDLEDNVSLNQTPEVLTNEKESSSLARSPDYSTIFTILQFKDILPTLRGPFTLFIPSDEALRRIPPEKIRSWTHPENQGELSNLIKNHIVPQKISDSDLKSTQVKTLGGKELDIRIENGKITVNGAHVLRTETADSNGIIYIIDKPLIP